MKKTKYNNRYKSAKRRSSKKKATSNSNLSFAIQMVALTLVLCILAGGIELPSTIQEPSEETIQKETIQNESTSSTITATEDVPVTTKIATEPTLIDPNALSLEIHQIDVSCANAYLIRYDNFTIFVDGGQSFSYDNVVEYLDNFGVKSIDCYIATHWHKDHVANMSKLLNSYGHERTLVYGTSKSPHAKYNVSKGSYEQMLSGDTFKFGDLSIVCVGPDVVTQNGDANPDSLNILFKYKDFRFLMTSDYMKDAVVNTYGELVKDIDLLQMPHHGLAPFFISETAIQHCNPSMILVPADASKPTRNFVDFLGLDAEILDNTNGCITVVSYGTGYNVYTNVTSPTDLK